VTGKLVFIDLDIDGFVEFLALGTHQQKVILDISVAIRAREKQHGCVVSNVKRDRVVVVIARHNEILMVMARSSVYASS
jgi:hypothetical protein